MKITTVGQLRQALSKFKDEDNIMLNLSDDYQTYDIGLELNSHTGPGMKDEDIAFYNNGMARMDFRLKAYKEDNGYRVGEMRAKVSKYNQ